MSIYGIVGEFAVRRDIGRSCAPSNCVSGSGTPISHPLGRLKRIKAHIRPVLRIPLCLRAFSDFSVNAGRGVSSEIHPGETTQGTCWQAEAAMAGGSQRFWRRSKICA
jgi:hypothetical protein